MVAATAQRVKPTWLGPLATVGVAAVLFWLAYDAGSYPLGSRAALAVAAWWTVVLTLALGAFPRVPRTALVAGAFLAAFGAWTALSIAWAESAERALAEANRVALFLGVFLVAILGEARLGARRLAAALALALGATGLLSLASRLFPATLPSGDVPDFVPAAVTRLSYPLEYWNGLAILVALSFPLLLTFATVARRPAWRGLAVGVLPALVATIYLTSSRGGFATALVGTGAFLVLSPRRWSAAGAAALAAAGSVGTIAVLLARDAVVDDPFSPDAVGEGRSAAVLVVLIAVATGLAYALASRSVRLSLPSPAGRIAAGLVVLAAAAGIAASHPVERLETFRQPPAADPEEDFVRAHLLSGNGSGRWQFWSAAFDEWQTEPWKGRGAGSYESWWAEHGTVALFIRDAHSLYLETLGELGVVGLVLLAGALGAGLVFGIARLLAARGEERVLLAGAVAALVAYLVAAGIEWMWELTVVTVVAIVLLAILTGGGEADEEPARPRPLPAVALALAAVLVIAVQAIPWLSELKLTASEASAGSGDLPAAIDEAAGARDLEPWAASPYLQLALLGEQAGDLAGARAAILEAIERDRRDWRLWLVRARLETKAGEIAAARRSLRRAASLNPRSPLFASAA